jgi:putative membrane protein
LPLDRRKSGSLIRVIDFFLLWSWFSGIVGNLFFFDRPGIALLGGIAFGLIVLPYFFNRRFGPPAEL